ncbi:hypothetical protein ACNSOS_05970 [Aliarcobacter vitoriensis]|uniref:hypothetical protein n=1 Tax=Aliarcobacter vitoriensis TaxID=2011099 RepID=UPI003AAB320B
MEINQTTNIYQTQSVKNLSTAYYKELEKIDYSNYSANDLLNISFEEAKTHQEEFDKRYKELSDNGDIKASQYSKFLHLKGALNYSENSSINKAYYETLQNTDPEKTGLLSFEFQMNLQEFSNNEDINASFMKNGRSSNDNYVINHKNELNNIDFVAFIDKAIANFEKALINSKSSNADKKVQEQYQNISDFYKNFQENFNKATKEPYYA